MKEASPTAYKVGTLREFADWTKQVVRDSAEASDATKKQFDSEATSRKAASDHVSAEAIVSSCLPAIRQRDGKIMASAFKSESAAYSYIRNHVAPGPRSWRTTPTRGTTYTPTT